MKFLLILEKKVDARYVLSSSLEDNTFNLSDIFNQISIGKKNYDTHEIYIEGECRTTLAYVKTDIVITYYNANNNAIMITSKQVNVNIRADKFERTPVLIDGFVLEGGYVEIHASVSNKSDKRSSSSNTLTYR